jgi:sporulation protein YlmC with PRC-barrel domain
MQFNKGAQVILSNHAPVGKLDRVIIDPRTMAASDIVVKHGMLSSQKKIVPTTLIEKTDGDGIYLKEIAGGWNTLPDFEETEYRLVEEQDLANMPDYNPAGPPGLFAYPSVLPVTGNVFYPPGEDPENFSKSQPDLATGYTKNIRRNIPPESIALKEGSSVISIDGANLGNIERIFTNPENGSISHFVISKGLFSKERKLIPASWVDEVLDTEVRLGIKARFVEHLPGFNL